MTAGHQPFFHVLHQIAFSYDKPDHDAFCHSASPTGPAETHLSNTRTGKGLRITRPGKGGQILPLPAISASIRARITKLGKRKNMPVNFMVCNFGDLWLIF